MTPPPVCPYRDPVTGAVCGYQAIGDTPKAQLTDLFRHEAEHVKALKSPTAGLLLEGGRMEFSIVNPNFAVKVWE